MIGPPTDERTVLIGLLFVDGLLRWGSLLIGDTLIIGVGKIFTSKGAVEVQELDKTAGDWHAGAALEASPGPLRLLLLQYVMPPEPLDLVDVGGGQPVVGGVSADGVREGHGTLETGCLGGDLEQITVDISAL